MTSFCRRRKEGSIIKSNKVRRAAVYIPAFAIPAGVLLAAYAAMGMFPWGDKTILISDMSDVYVELFCALKNGDLFFSWSKALGTSYIGVFSYHVSSPLSFLTLLVPNEYMPVGLMFLTVLKLGLAGLSYAVYSMRKFPGAELTTVLCASCYGLMSYNIALSLSIMWLDGVIWLPLILLALERILAGRGAGPFIAALTVCFLSTWYISYMIGIFCCIYLTVRLVGLKPDRAALFRVLGRFSGGAACALGLTAWLWLPTFLAMFNGKFQAQGSGWKPSGTVYGPLSDVFDQLRPGQLTSITNSGLPNIFCGTVVVVLAAAWFFLRAVPLREKLASAGALAVLFLSLWSTGLDKVWHLFQYPNWFPFRYSFVVSFFLIYLANQALPALTGKPVQALARGTAAVLLLFTVAELHYNTNTLLAVLDGQFHYQAYETYRSYYTANAALVDEARSYSGGEFCRINTTSDRGHNAPLSFGYPGINHYSSLFNQKLNQLLRSLGLAQAWYWSSGYGSTPVTDALLGVRYVISRDAMPPEYEAVAEAGGYTLYENPCVLPLAFWSAGEDVPVLSAAATPFERQNDLLSGLAGGSAAAFTPVNGSVSEAETQAAFTFTGTGRAVYADLSASGLKQVLVNDVPVVILGTSEAASVHYLGTPNPGETWTVTVRHSGGWSAPEAFLWELDSPDPWESRLSAVAGAVQAIGKAEALEVKQNGAVRLSVTTDAPRQLLTTIPAEDGWRAYVDGVRVETVVWLDTFLSVDVPAGTHRVELRYTAPGLMPGLTLGLVSAAGLAACVVRRKCKEKRETAP